MGNSYQFAFIISIIAEITVYIKYLNVQDRLKKGATSEIGGYNPFDPQVVQIVNDHANNEIINYQFKVIAFIVVVFFIASLLKTEKQKS